MEPPARRAIPSGRPPTAPYLAAPAAGSWLRAWSPLSATPRPPTGLLCVPRLRGNRPEPERSRLVATVGPGRDVTTMIEGAAEGTGDSRRAPSGVTSLLTGNGAQASTGRTRSAPTHPEQQGPPTAAGWALRKGRWGTRCQFR